MIPTAETPDGNSAFAAGTQAETVPPYWLGTEIPLPIFTSTNTFPSTFAPTLRLFCF